MKNIILLVISCVLVLFAGKAYAADCVLPYNGTFTLTTNCTWPDGYKIYGDIVVGAYTITMGANDDMGIDLATNKITFTTGKIDLDTTARIDNHVTARYYVSVSYGQWGSTWCPSGMLVFDTAHGTPPSAAGTTNFRGATVRYYPSSGTFYCGL